MTTTAEKADPKAKDAAKEQPPASPSAPEAQAKAPEKLKPGQRQSTREVFPGLTDEEIMARAKAHIRTKAYKARKAQGRPYCNFCRMPPKTDLVSREVYCPYERPECPLVLELSPNAADPLEDPDIALLES